VVGCFYYKGNPLFSTTGTQTQSLRYEEQILSVQFNVSLVIAVFISGGVVSTLVRFLDFITWLVLILGLERNWRLRLPGVCRCFLPS
jgi:uncharacterized membrane protein